MTTATMVRHFCHVCNVRFYRATDFVTHRHSEVKPLVGVFTSDKPSSN